MQITILTASPDSFTIRVDNDPLPPTPSQDDELTAFKKRYATSLNSHKCRFFRNRKKGLA